MRKTKKFGVATLMAAGVYCFLAAAIWQCGRLFDRIEIDRCY